MIHIAGLVLTLLVCGWLCYQDFGKRYINVWSIGLLIIALVAYSYNSVYDVDFFVINILYLGGILLLLFLYFFFVRRANKIIDRYIGLGDVLIFIVLALGYNLFNYTVLLLTGCVFSLIYFFVSAGIARRRTVRIPLAGCLAIAHAGWTLLFFLIKKDLFVDNIKLFH